MKTANEETIKGLADNIINKLIVGNVTPLSAEYYSSSDRVVLIISSCGGQATPSQISKILKVTSPRVTVVLNSMEKNGLISRALDKNDRRIIRVKLTAKGRKENERMIKNLEDYLKNFVEREGNENEDLLLGYLSDFIKFNLEEDQ